MPEIAMRLFPEELRSIDSATFDGTYKDLGTPLEFTSRIFKITNNSNVDITVSYDGGDTDHEFVPAGSFLLIDVCSNRVATAQFVLSRLTQVSVKGAAGAGSVYFSTYYAG